MTRRDFLATLGVSFLAPRVLSQRLPNYTYAIENCQLFIHNSWQKRTIGILADGTYHISEQPITAEKTISGEGLVLSSGFIDILTDNSASPRQTYKIVEEYKISDGVTAALQMHGGAENPQNYYQEFSVLPHYTHFGVSTKVMNIRNRYPTLPQRLYAVETALEKGKSLGVSHSIEYQPTPYDELIQYGKIAAKYKRPFCLHLRYSSAEQELLGVDEALKIALTTCCHLHIDHLHSTGGTFQMEKALTKIKEAISKGANITTCVYPYSFWATYLHSKRFDPGWQQRFGLTYQDLTIVGTGERLNEASFAKYRKQAGILVAVPEGTMPLEKTIDLALREPFSMIASDGGIEKSVLANSHPRGAGCFSTAIAHGLKIGLPLEDILAKVTQMPAKLLPANHQQRAILAHGNYADLTLFNPKKINGKATVSNPNQYSFGIEYVFVQGKLAYAQNKLHETNGKPIRYE